MKRNYEFIDSGGAPIRAWVNGVEFDANTRLQVEKTSRLPFVHGVALMPDVHLGIGSTVGSVVATRGAIVPAMVGVDIGCGMIASRTSLTAEMLPDSLSEMRLKIEANVPTGRENWSKQPRYIRDSFKDLYERLVLLEKKHPVLKTWLKRAEAQVATLGGGNHFIEVCLDQNNNVWIMLHSGSRGVGNVIGRYFIEMAREDMRKWFINLPDMDLSYFPEGTDHFDDYIEAVSWAQDFARLNRDMMMEQVLFAIRNTLGIEFEAAVEAVNCHHNYVEMEHHQGINLWVTRKGAVRARETDMGIIPGSMGARSFIVRGKGNADSYQSCSHGAGRKMSRAAAKKSISLTEHLEAVKHVECSHNATLIDESPGAYKGIDAVMAAQTDLVDVLYELHQVVNVKGES